eukprot:TRINITY_DN8643_c0_g1_i1.p1 TRINITY_DN8643_c0_g1~~TRINITY_DN8643_c0_g1_i1.p1  ORF type:complete len:219 (-),score=21.49 TRINITY_DN8643_c0_g1_i1:137-793(-)
MDMHQAKDLVFDQHEQEESTPRFADKNDDLKKKKLEDFIRELRDKVKSMMQHELNLDKLRRDKLEEWKLSWERQLKRFPIHITELQGPLTKRERLENAKKVQEEVEDIDKFLQISKHGLEIVCTCNLKVCLKFCEECNNSFVKNVTTHLAEVVQTYCVRENAQKKTDANFQDLFDLFHNLKLLYEKKTKREIQIIAEVFKLRQLLRNLHAPTFNFIIV